MRKQAFTQVSEVPVRVSRWGHTLIHLHHMHVLPRDLSACQGAQHLPRGVAAADGHDETATHGYGRPRLGGDDRRSLLGNRLGLSKYVNFHESAPNPDKPVTVAFCQPPTGETL